MRVSLQRANPDEYSVIHEMQLRAFEPLLLKYRDYDTNPGAETPDRVRERLIIPGSDCHFIFADGVCVGMIRVRKVEDGHYRIGPFFVLPEAQNRGIAQSAIRLALSLYRDARLWSLDTIMEEEKLCHLYEKCGFTRSDFRKKVQDGMTLIGYERRME